MRALITGADGQLGRELQLACPAGIEMTALGHRQLDLTDFQQIESRLQQLAPDMIINAAAYTAVDRAESDRQAAFAVNSDGVAHLARLVQSSGARLLHVSTDFVFSGRQSRPYRPDDATDPAGAYGASKLAGEESLQAIAADRTLIVRTSWLYSRFGHNFVKTMLRLLAEREEIAVVVDQVGTPTWARGLAVVLWAAAADHGLSGLYHWSDGGVASWYDFAVAIQEEAAGLGLLDSSCRIRPIATSAYPTAAERPSFSVLDTRAVQSRLGIEVLHWRRQLRGMLRDLQSHGEE